MVMRSIPALMDESSSHISIAVPRHLKEGSPPPSSSSDSDEDIDELPFIPMPLNMEFSGSRMSLNEIIGDDEIIVKTNSNLERSGPTAQKPEPMECEQSVEATDADARGRARKRTTLDDEKGSSDEESGELSKRAEQPKRPLRRGSSMDSDKPEGARRRGELRRGSSADSALQLHIKPEEGAEESPTEGRRILKKSLSMELPRRSPSPGAAKLSQEDYALKLELMRQRLLRGGSVDNKMSGLRGPLLETLGMGDEKCFIRGPRLSNPPLVRAASSDSPRDDIPKTKVLRKSASFSQGDAEPMPLHRRIGAPLEIPVAQVEERRLQEAVSMSMLAEPVKPDSRPITPKPLTPEPKKHEKIFNVEDKEPSPVREFKHEGLSIKQTDIATVVKGDDQKSSDDAVQKKDLSMLKENAQEPKKVPQSRSTPVMVPRVIVEKIEEEEEGEEKELMESVIEQEPAVPKMEDKEIEEGVAPDKSSEIIAPTSTIEDAPSLAPQSMASTYVTPSPPVLTVLPDGRKSAYASIMQAIIVPSLQPPSQPTTIPISTNMSTMQTSPTGPVPGTMSRHISEPVLLSTTPSSKSDTQQTTEHPAVFSRVASVEQAAKEPSPPKTPTHASPKRDSSPGGQIKDLASEEVFEARFKKRESSLTRGLKILSWQKMEEKPTTVSPEVTEEMYRPGPVGAPLEFVHRKLEEKSKSVQDLREAEKDPGFMRRLSMRLKRSPSLERNEEKPKEQDNSVPRRRLSWALGRRGSQDKKEVEMMRLDGGPEAPPEPETKTPNESPVLAMRRKISNTVAGISMKIRSHSEERKDEKEKTETKKTPLLSILRRSTSEGGSLKRMGIPQNQLASQSGNGASSESLDSMSSIQSESVIKSMLHNNSFKTYCKIYYDVDCELALIDAVMWVQAFVITDEVCHVYFWLNNHKSEILVEKTVRCTRIGSENKLAVIPVLYVHYCAIESECYVNFLEGAETERRSRWDRWGLTRGRRDKTISQPDIPTAIARENGSLRSRQYSRTASGMPFSSVDSH